MPLNAVRLRGGKGVEYEIERILDCTRSGLASSVIGLGQQSPRWHGPSQHKVQFVTVEDGVRLAVLDWKGRGRKGTAECVAGSTRIHRARVRWFAEKLTVFLSNEADVLREFRAFCPRCAD
jgi:hypothetical protein